MGMDIDNRGTVDGDECLGNTGARRKRGGRHHRDNKPRTERRNHLGVSQDNFSKVRSSHREALVLVALVVGGFLSDDDIMDVAFPVPCLSDTHELGARFQLFDVSATTIAHARLQPTD